MPESLVLVTIGPVQPFITAARRMRDLYCGSKLLSELSRAAARAVAENAETRLIFPGSQETVRDDQRDIANRIIATTAGDARALAEAAERAVRERLRALRDEAFRPQQVHWQTGDGLSAAEFEAVAKAQVDALVEVSWAAVPLGADYPRARRTLEAVMAARKGTRDFGQVTWGAARPKSSIDGERESVIPESAYAKPGESPTEAGLGKAEALFEDFGTGPAERLSGVDLLKRHARPAGAGEAARFPSTTHIAALPYLVRLSGDRRARFEAAFPGLCQTLRKWAPDLDANRLPARYTRNLPTGTYDASVISESHWRGEVAETAAAAIEREVRDFWRAVRDTAPEPYYAILHADGDNMGKVIDGQDDWQRHQQLSEALAAFAGGVRGIVEGTREAGHEGALIYAGGDDVLALVPLHRLLACVDALARAYQACMGAYRSRDGVPSTLSVGVAICHHLEPLAAALDLARAAETAAKTRFGKNALAITLRKRAGADLTVGGKFGGPFLARLRELVAWHRADAVPDGAAYDLRTLDKQLTGWKNPDLLATARAAEAGRILARKRGQRGQTALTTIPNGQPAAEAGDADSRYRSIAATMTGWLKPGDRRWDVSELAEGLILARELARALGPAEQGV